MSVARGKLGEGSVVGLADGEIADVLASLRKRFAGLRICSTYEFDANAFSRCPPALFVVEIAFDRYESAERLLAIERSCPTSAIITVGGSLEGELVSTRARHLPTPIEPSTLESVIVEVLSRRTASVVEHGLVGESAVMHELRASIHRIAATDVTVLVTGETGTGKELAARAIHSLSRRRHGPFVAVNCAALPDGLLESELFGHERGAFTGAASRRIGRFEQANDGTVFLDEIGDTSPLFQARLLRVLQERTIQRVGGNVDISVTGRVVAATHRDLYALCEAGRFRQDLLYRMSVVELRMPALRERTSDIPLLVEHFVERIGRELGRRGVVVSSSAIAKLQQQDWPGNVRELEHRVKQALVLADSEILEAKHLRMDETWKRPSDGISARGDEVPLSALVREFLRREPGTIHEAFVAHVERALFAELLRRTNDNLSRAASMLGLSRPTLRIRLQRLGLRAHESETNDGP